MKNFEKFQLKNTQEVVGGNMSQEIKDTSNPMSMQGGGMILREDLKDSEGVERVSHGVVDSIIAWKDTIILRR